MSNERGHLVKKIKRSATLTLVTGMRIGDSKDSVEIGGVDAPFVRRRDNNQPYIPGSSLKGKLRCLLELSDVKTDLFKPFQNNGGAISQLFGAMENKSKNLESVQSRLIVRDAFLIDQSEKMLADSPYTDTPYGEIKFENSINRLKGTADSPRQFERVPAGAQFRVELVVNIFEHDTEGIYIKLLDEAFKLLEMDYLGGSGSRGYGQVSLSKWDEDPIDIIQLFNV